LKEQSKRQSAKGKSGITEGEMTMKIKPAVLMGILAVALTLPSCTPPSWVVEAENIAKVALPIVAGLSSILGGSPVVSQVVNDINAVIALFDDYQKQPSATTLEKIQAGITAVNADLAQILPAARIQNAATQNKVTAILQLVSSEFSQIASLVPAESQSGVRSPKSEVGVPESGVGIPESGGKKQVARLPFSAKEFKGQYNKIVRSKTGDPGCDAAFAGKELN
jgi:hypothetical protein